MGELLLPRLVSHTNHCVWHKANSFAAYITMKPQTLVLQRDLFERAIERASLVRAALVLLQEEGKYLDFQNLAPALLARVSIRYGLRMDRPRDVQQAKAYALLIINLALDRATGGSPERSAAALSKNEPTKIYMIGERLIDEVRERIDVVLKKNVFGVRDREKRRHQLEVLPADVRDRLMHWSNVGMVKLDGWPPSTMADIAECHELVELSEFDVQLAKHVDWNRIFSMGRDAAFALMYFRRPKRGVVAPSGGIWHAFLRSLYINAMVSEAWLKSREIRLTGSADDLLFDAIRHRLFVDSDALRLFVERIVTEPEELADRYVETTARIAQTMMAKHGGEAIFARAVSAGDVLLASKRAESLLRGLAQDAFNFYLSVDDVMKIDSDTLDRFWSSRVILVSRMAAELRFEQLSAERTKPWERLPNIKSPEDLSAILGGFGGWPKDEQDRFLSSSSEWMRVLIPPVSGKRDAHGDSFARILISIVEAGAAQRFLDTVTWDKVDFDMISAVAISSGSLGEAAPWFGQVVGRRVSSGLSVEKTQRLLGDLKVDAGFESAIMVASDGWTEANWTRIFRPGNWSMNRGKVEAGWDAMSPEMRPVLADITDGATLGRCVVEKCDLEQAKAFVLEVSRWANTQDKRRIAKNAWLSRHGPGMRDVLNHRWPGTDWDRIFTVKNSG
jgi:hypothetical protein